MKKRLVASLIMFCLIISLATGCGAEKSVEAEQEKISVVKVSSVQKGEIFDQIKMGGNLSANQEINLIAKYGGKIDSIPVSIGDTVQEGQILAKLESDDVLAAVQQAEAGLAIAKVQAETNYQTSLDNFKRMEVLYNQGAISKQQFEQAESQFKIASAQYSSDKSLAQIQQAEANLQRSLLQLADTMIKAPFAGTVAMKNLQVGDMASPGMPIISIVDIDKLKLMIAVTESYINKMQIGQKVEVQIPAINNKYSATISTISPVTSPQTKTYPVELILENKDRLLKPGMYAESYIVIDHKKDILILPERSLIERDGLYQVFVIKDGIAEQRQIEVGLKNGIEFEVISGLNEGEQVVTVGHETLANGDKVAIANKGV